MIGYGTNELRLQSSLSEKALTRWLFHTIDRSAFLVRPGNPRKKQNHRWIFITLLLLLLSGAGLSAFAVASDRYSADQINSYLKIVTTKFEASHGSPTLLSGSSASTLSCFSEYLGEGQRGNERGFYAWFTCSKIHILSAENQNPGNFSCTGFSLPLWIAPEGTSARYESATTPSAYTSLLNSAPIEIRARMNSTYSLVHQLPVNFIASTAGNGSLSIEKKSLCS